VKIRVLASGSKGNSIYVETFSAKVLIDCGISFKKICEKLNSTKNTLNLDACLITHEHIDHINGLNVFVKNTNSIIYCSKGTKEAINIKNTNVLNNSNCCVIKNLESIYINNLKITPFLVSHDAKEPFGYILEEDNVKAVFLTDSGYVDRKYYDLLKNANVYYFESNHDVEMLINSDRPYYLKQRILGSRGHLSKEAAADFARHCAEHGTREIVLAHLSRENNTPVMAYDAVARALAPLDTPPQLSVAPREEMSCCYRTEEIPCKK
jgi:phosphoribosyl 1,2-cyclic phosphodiesterase